jgi:cytochrome c peroxidase
MKRAAGLVLAAMAGLACIAAAQPAYRWSLPCGIAPPPIPADNPMSDVKVELGRRLFYDAGLSVDGTLSCATCHEQRHGFAEAEATHGGVKGAAGRRNVMTLANVGYLSTLTWADPAQTTLEGQVAVPMMGDHPVEMGMAGQEAELTRRLSADTCYRTLFAGAFPETKGAITLTSTSKALAAFERTLLSFNAPYDRAARGDRRALSDQARAGQALFQDKGCAGCHAGPNFTDGQFHAIRPSRTTDHGLAEKTGRPADQDQFRTPGLRNVQLSAPYLHDGSAHTLATAIFAHDSAVETVSQDDAWSLEAFLNSLTDPGFITDKRLALPTRLCGKGR